VADKRDVQQSEKIAALLLIGAAALALIAANTGLSHPYHELLEAKIGPAMPRFGVMSIHYWVADGLMAIFFLLVGLEVKREWYDGRLSNPRDRRLPFIGAAAGMAVPAIVYLLVIGFDPALRSGWAIPAATDIAFAIGVLALLGDRANPAVKLLLVTIAIIDDVGAVLIIAFVYTESLDLVAIGAAVALVATMMAMNIFGVRRLWPYMIAFALLWYAMLASGVHATIAGVLAALTIPLGRGGPYSPLKRLEHGIHPWVMFGIMPVFGFVSAGVEIGVIADLFQPLPLAIMAGLFVGKQIGVFGAIWLADKTGIAPRPPYTRWLELYGASLLCGIGFTMSLFIGALAFPNSPEAVEAAKLGTLSGSFLAALAGYTVLRLTVPIAHSPEDRRQAMEIFADKRKKGQPVQRPQGAEGSAAEDGEKPVRASRSTPERS
jgi:NhaA family Na+:H+ antiporter